MWCSPGFSFRTFTISSVHKQSSSTSFFTSLFADTTGFLKLSNYLETLFLTADHELSEAFGWFQANKLTLNVSKSKYILYSEINPCHLKIRVKISK